MVEILKKAERIFNKFGDALGYVCMVVMFLMIADVFFNAAAMYLFKYGNVGLQELEWHFFGVIILLGMSYVLKEDAHVRVDVFYDKFSPKTKAVINMLGAIFFILPLAMLVVWYGWDFMMEAYEFSEKSSNPGGLTHRWIIKAFIPFGFTLLIFFSLGYFVKNLNLYIAAKFSADDTQKGGRK